MPCTPLDLLELASSLHDSQIGEAHERCAISRAYYAALHKVEATFPVRAAFKPDHESSHAEIIGRATAYGNSLQPGRTDANELAYIISRLRRARNQADYKLQQVTSHDEAANVITRAKRVLQLCDNVAQKIEAHSKQA